MPLRLRKFPSFLIGLSLPILLFAGVLIRLGIAFQQAPQPQLILTLGGGPLRPQFTAQFAQAHPSLDVWISSGLPPEQVKPIFQAAEIPERRVHLDYEAVDTVTNFTTLVDDLKRREVKHLYLITSDFHLRRAAAIAILVFGSQGIAFTPVGIPTQRPPEPLLFAVLDILRAVLWLLTGYTGAGLNAYFSYDQIHRVF